MHVPRLPLLYTAIHNKLDVFLKFRGSYN
jgi:hypothetical protein